MGKVLHIAQNEGVAPLRELPYTSTSIETEIALFCLANFMINFTTLLAPALSVHWVAFGPGPGLMGRLRPFVTGIHKGGFCLVYFTFCSPSPPLNPLFPILLRHFISLLTPAPSSLAKYRNFTYRHFYFLNKTLILQVRGFQHLFPGRLQLHFILE